MQFRSYNSEFKTANAQFMDIFNDITIDRRDVKDTVQETIKVICVLGPRSRQLKSLENKNKTLKLPIISIQPGNFSRDASRAHDLNSGITLQTMEWDYDAGYNAPVPINIQYEVTILTEYWEDADMIVCNFVTMFNPDLYVVWGNPRRPGEYLKSHVIWDGQCSKQFPSENPLDPSRFMYTCNFTYKTWLFPGLKETPSPDGPLIHKINFDTTLLPFGTEGYGLDKWYQVPTNMSFSDFRGNLLCGYIKADNGRDNWDYLPLSAGVSGYWNDLNPLLASGILSGSNVSLSGDVYYVRTGEGNLLFYLSENSGQLLTPGYTMYSYLSAFGM